MTTDYQELKDSFEADTRGVKLYYDLADFIPSTILEEKVKLNREAWCAWMRDYFREIEANFANDAPLNSRPVIAVGGNKTTALGKLFAAAVGQKTNFLALREGNGFNTMENPGPEGLLPALLVKTIEDWHAANTSGQGLCQHWVPWAGRRNSRSNGPHLFR